MKVVAKCIARAWDSDSCVMLEPGGGPLPGGLYEIERDGKLASLTVNPVSYDKNGNPIKYYRDHDGNIKTQIIPQPPYVFEFDRAAPGSNADYTCDQCGQKFKSLNKLGTHVHSEHPDGSEAEAEDEGEVFADRTCNLCNPPRVCKSPYGLRVHQERAHGIARKEAEVQDAVEV